MPNINDFLSSFTTEVARPNRFTVTIIPPALLDYTKTLRQLTYRCENAQLPSRTFATVDQKFGSNPTQKFPMHTSYNDLSLSFIVSGDMSEKNFFDVWMELINPSTSFDFNYKNNFVSTIYVTQYDINDNPTYTAQFFNAYPLSVNQMDLDWANESVHKLNIDFAYDYWAPTGYINIPLPTPSAQNIPALSFPPVGSTASVSSVASQSVAAVTSQPNQTPLQTLSQDEYVPGGP
jgi:hypothetical protein